MDVELTIKNYRCFPDARPAHFILRKGFTALVGPNNSGKSSLLKFFFELRPLFQIFSQPTHTIVQILQADGPEISFPASVWDPEEVFSNLNGRALDVEMQFRNLEEGQEQEKPHPLTKVILTVLRGTRRLRATILYSGNELRGTNLGLKDTLVCQGSDQIVNLSAFFETCKDFSQMVYIGAFRNAVNVGTNSNYFDIQIGQAFIEHWKEHKTGNVKRQNEVAYRLTEDIKRIFGFRELEINPARNDQTLQVFINGRSYKLSELGSGLAQFIMVLINAGIREPSFVLIDEPELNLHPALQLDFLTTLGSYARSGVIFATHSIGLARAAADRVYSVRKVGEGESEIADYEATPRLPEFLGEFSFSSYRELGFDKVLLVEGRSDVKTLQQFLRLYRKDHQVVLLPLGGTQLINDVSEAELVEIKRIAENVSVLIDSERNAVGEQLQSGREAFINTCKQLGMNCHVLERRATENYLTDKAVKLVKGEKYRSLTPYKKLKDLSPAWAKEENWRISSKMTLSDLEGTDLGAFLKSL